MKISPLSFAAACCVAAYCYAADPALGSGIDRDSMDTATRAQDDLFRHMNGKWLETTQIPPDKAQYGGWLRLEDETLLQLRGIVEGFDAGGKPPADADARKIADLYASFMDEARIASLGAKPLEAEFARIDAIKRKDEFPALIAHLQEIGVSVPFDPQVHQDAKDSTKYVFDLSQGGLGMPDRDYYLKLKDAKLGAVRAKYLAHVEKMLAMAGEARSAAAARDILALETRLARVQWTKVQNRDPVKTYNPIKLAKLSALAPGYDWKRYADAAKIEGRVDGVVVSQPSYLKGFARIARDAPLPVWKAYFKWHLLAAYAPYLPQDFVDERFAFSGTAVRGIPENRPRWKRGLAVTENSIGEALGKLYVAKYFPPEKKARMDELVKNLLITYKQSIDALGWMGPETKREAQAKLALFTPKIGYPAKWRDYSTLQIERGDLVGNVMRAQRFEYDRNLAKLGQPIDRDEWYMTPQTINAYYNPEMNEIVFPAAILQAPFFNVEADDAVNYGSIGAVIGHEISHGFDDAGSQYDGKGNLREWWTKQDHARFSDRTRALTAQYGGYSPVAGYPLNGELTLGENIADNSGLAIAYKAYRLSLHGKEAPVIDGWTGDQRFFLGWAQAWQEKTREAEMIRLVKIDPHSPPEFRANGAARNLAAFHSAFGTRPGDRMYVAPDKRIVIW
jgi:predicted metalloendopeptidase